MNLKNKHTLKDLLFVLWGFFYLLLLFCFVVLFSFRTENTNKWYFFWCEKSVPGSSSQLHATCNTYWPKRLFPLSVIDASPQTKIWVHRWTLACGKTSWKTLKTLLLIMNKTSPSTCPKHALPKQTCWSLQITKMFWDCPRLQLSWLK